MERWGWWTPEAEGRREGSLPPGLLCWIMDLTRTAVPPGGCCACKGLEIMGLETESAVSRVVGKSINRWIWMPSPGPIWEMWLKLEGAEIILERRSGFLNKKQIRQNPYFCRAKNAKNVENTKTSKTLLRFSVSVIWWGIVYCTSSSCSFRFYMLCSSGL